MKGFRSAGGLLSFAIFPVISSSSPPSFLPSSYLISSHFLSLMRSQRASAVVK
jgi:hypothetical protein